MKKRKYKLIYKIKGGWNIDPYNTPITKDTVFTFKYKSFILFPIAVAAACLVLVLGSPKTITSISSSDSRNAYSKNSISNNNVYNDEQTVTSNNGTNTSSQNFNFDDIDIDKEGKETSVTNPYVSFFSSSESFYNTSNELGDTGEDDDPYSVVPNKCFVIVSSNNKKMGSAINETISEEYNLFDRIRLVAIPNEGYSFQYWKLNGTKKSTDATYSTYVSADGVNSYVAVFEINKYDIDVVTNKVDYKEGQPETWGQLKKPNIISIFDYKFTVFKVPHFTKITVNGDTINVNGTKMVAVPEESTKQYTYKFKDFTYDEEVHGEATFYANFEAVLNSYDIEFHLNNHGYPKPVNQSVLYGKTIEKPNNPNQEGYTFDGWYLDIECTKPWDFSTVLDDETITDEIFENKKITLYAKWTAKTYNIELKDGDETTTIEQTYDQPMADLEEDKIPQKPGYEFKGYFDEPEGGKKYIDENGKSVGEWDKDEPQPTLYAQYEAIEYGVILDDGLGNKTPIDPTFGEPMPEIEAPTREGYKFGGYYDNPNGTGDPYYDADGESAKNWDKPDDGTTLYAHWIPEEYEVTLDDGVGHETKVNPTFGEDMPELPEIPEKPGYKFGGYYDNPNGTGDPYYNADGTSGKPWDKPNDSTLTAYWIPEEYEVTLDDGSDNKPVINQTFGEDMPELPEIPEKPGYKFGGYYDNPNGTGDPYYNADGTSGKPWDKPNDAILTVYWIPEEYEVTLADGVGHETKVNPTFGKDMPEISKPTRDGYKFGGYYDKPNGEGNQYYDENGDSNKTWDKPNDATLTAYWIPEEYKVTLDDGSDNKPVINQTFGEDMSDLPKLPTKTGYKFGGYYDKPNGEGNQYYDENGNSDKTWDKPANTTLYAKWSVNQYTLTVKSNGNGTVSGGGTFDYGTSHTITATPNNGYRFVKWSDNNTNASRSVTIKTTDNEYTAIFESDSFAVTFNANGHGTAPAKQTIKYGGTVTDPGNLSATGWAFDGWYKEAACTNKWNFSTDKVTVDTILYAKWTASSYKLTVTTTANTDGTVSGGGTFDYGTSHTITATPNTGYCFVSWTDGNTNATRTITMPANDVTYTAIFKEDYATVTINQATGGYGSLFDKDSNYELLEYIKGTGKQWIETGVKVTDGLMFKVKVMALEQSPACIVGGQAAGGAGTRLFNPVINGTGRLYLDYGNGVSGGGRHSVANEFKQGEIYEFEAGNHYVINLQTGKTVLESNKKQFADQNYTVGVFANSNYTGGAQAKIYYLQIYNDGTLVRDYIPVREKSTGKIGLYDKLNNKFYSSQTGVNFETETTNTYKVQKGNTVKLTATPDSDSGYAFDQWNGGNKENPRSVVVNSDVTYTPQFIVNSYYLTAIPNNIQFGKVVVDTNGSSNNYVNGSQHKLTATANDGYHFVRWKEDSVTTNPRTITINPTSNYYTAIFEINTYTVTFNANGHGTAPAAKTTNYNTTITAPTEPKVDGYTFGGWYKEAACTNAFNFSTKITANTTLYAKWTPVTYSITYNLASGSVATANPTTYTIETNTFTLNNPTRTGYTFAGWTGTGLSSASKTVSIAKGSTGNRSYTATWTANNNIPYKVEHYQEQLDGTYKIADTENKTGTTDATVSATAKTYEGFTYDSKVSGTIASKTVKLDGSLVLKLYYKRIRYTVSIKVGQTGYGSVSTTSISNVPHGTKITTSNNTINVNGTKVTATPESNNAQYTYAFKDWTNGTATVTGNNTTVTANFTRTVNQYTVTFINMDGTVLDSQAVDYGSPIPVYKGKDPTWPMTDELVYKFKGFITPLLPDGVTSDLSLTANYDILYRVKFDANGHGTAPKEQDIEWIDFDGFNVTKPNDLSEAGYTFGGWYSDKECKTQFNFSKKIKGAITLYAKWTESNNTAYKVQHYKEKLDGTYELAETENKTGTTNASVTASNKTYTGFDYDASNAKNVKTGNINANGSLVLKLYYKRKTFTVTFDTQGLDEAGFVTTPPKQTVKYEGTVTNPGNLSVPDFPDVKFVGWCTDTDGNNVWNFSTDKVTKDITLYSSWDIEEQESAALAGYSVCIYKEQLDGTYSLVRSTNEAASIGTQISVSTNNYYYPGYDFDSSNPNNVLSGTVVSGGSLKLKLYFKLKSYDVTFNTNGHGTAPAKQTIKYEGTVTDPGNLSATGWIFDGWYMDADCKCEWNFSKETISKNTTIYAKWIGAKYTVTLDDQNGSDVTKTISVTYNEGMPTIGSDSLPKKDHYQFMGYSDSIKDGKLYINADGTSANKWDKSNNATLYAQWKAEEYTILLDANGGAGGATSTTAPYNSQINKVTSLPTWEYHIFDGFYDKDTNKGIQYIDKNGNSVKNWDKGDNVTLYARWKKDYCTVKFDLQGHGSAIQEQKVLYDNRVIFSGDPTAVGYKFEGWFKDPQCTKYFATYTPVQSNLTLYAKWTEVTYDITFYWHQYATGAWYSPTTITVREGEIPSYSFTPSRTNSTVANYLFKGWDKPLVAATEDTTYYAQFNEIKSQSVIRLADGKKYRVLYKMENSAINGDFNDHSVANVKNFNIVLVVGLDDINEVDSDGYYKGIAYDTTPNVVTYSKWYEYDLSPENTVEAPSYYSSDLKSVYKTWYNNLYYNCRTLYDAIYPVKLDTFVWTPAYANDNSEFVSKWHLADTNTTPVFALDVREIIHYIKYYVNGEYDYDKAQKNCYFHLSCSEDQILDMYGIDKSKSTITSRPYLIWTRSGSHVEKLITLPYGYVDADANKGACAVDARTGRIWNVPSDNVSDFILFNDGVCRNRARAAFYVDLSKPGVLLEYVSDK